MAEILIGTSGYDHPELKGSFYPIDLPRKDFLEFYSTKFNALELNSSFMECLMKKESCLFMNALKVV